MENERHRHQVARVVQQIDDCVCERHGDEAVIDLQAVIKDTNRNSARREKQIGVLFGNAAVIVEEAAITNYDRVG